MSAGPSRSRLGRLAIAIALTIGMAPACLAVPAAAATAGQEVADCSRSFTPVRLAAGQAADHLVYGELCLPKGRRPHAVQVTVHGGAYTHVYWDFPYQPENYSYVEHMTRAGFATFTIDRIGNGASSRPLGALVDVATNGFVVHQLVDALRRGTLRNSGGVSFAKVVLAGHSLGSSVVFDVASKYPGDADGVIITGMAHRFAAGIASVVPALSWPAFLEPRFHTLDPSYLTTRPGTRGELFYDLSNADPEVIAIDEATKGTTTLPEAATFLPYLIDGTTSRIHLPVLVVLGQHDRLFCGGVTGTDCSSSEALLEQERPFYPPDAELEAFALPNAGHDINLQRNSAAWFNVAEQWLARHFSA
ncbi:alpha/beta hydrolase [Amycolatopsis thermoflava]|uniref:Alpha-beta hydrolase superfamily lysophospholipase n=1 Tax=Amycolatopsis thermoflava TaxID=84480 RepID=A0A3N2GR83_9PSEU|nr:alpha/beta fold hydrolase [Amycolatopsis thermoflava]ROS38425.1 alpha-beta hydrolase superfamily lysophospholipase [Amycolatopsis thermoflava]